MKFVVLLVGVVGLGAAVGLALPVSGPTGAEDPQADSAGKPQRDSAAPAEQEAGKHLLDYSRVVHAYREHVDEALQNQLRGTVLAAEQRGSGTDGYSLSADTDGSVRLVRTTSEGARITMQFRVRSEGEADALVTARVHVDLLPGKGALKHVPTAIINGVDLAKFAPADAIRKDVEQFVSRIEDEAKRRQSANDDYTARALTWEQDRRAKAMDPSGS